MPKKCLTVQVHELRCALIFTVKLPPELKTVTNNIEAICATAVINVSGDVTTDKRPELLGKIDDGVAIDRIPSHDVVPGDGAIYCLKV